MFPGDQLYLFALIIRSSAPQCLGCATFAPEISATLATSTKQIARVKSYGEALEEYEFHEEAKCADASGAPCGKQTVGLLQRRHVTIESIAFIGKESNKLEEVEEGSVPDAGDVYTEYPDARRDAQLWQVAREKLRAMSKSQLIEFEKETGISLATLKAWRRGRSPHTRNRRKLQLALREFRTRPERRGNKS